MWSVASYFWLSVAAAGGLSAAGRGAGLGLRALRVVQFSDDNDPQFSIVVRDLLITMTAARAIRFNNTHFQPEAHLFEVTCVIADPDPAGQRFSLPAWIPGSYMIREFAKNVVQLWASAGGDAVAVDKIDKSTWRCAPCDGPLAVRYQVYAWDLSVRGARLGATHGYFSGTCVFIRVEGKAGRPLVVVFLLFVGVAFWGWRVVSVLLRV